MADENKTIEQQPTTTQQPAVTTTPTQNAASSLDTYNQGREQKIRGLYDQSLNNNLNNLRSAYERNVTEAQRSYDKISPQYQSSMNELSAEYERQRRNNNMSAAANGLNTGAGSQMRLGQSMAYQQGQAGLQKQENEALDTANQNMLDLKTDYQNQIAAATANNDYQRAAALLDEYGQQYERQMTQASQLAEYGDFSMYANIYGNNAASQMERAWALQNPDLAYNLGKISAQDYFNMTGAWPRGYSAGGGGDSGGGGGGGYYYGGNSNNNNNSGSGLFARLAAAANNYFGSSNSGNALSGIGKSSGAGNGISNSSNASSSDGGGSHKTFSNAIKNATGGK